MRIKKGEFQGFPPPTVFFYTYTSIITLVPATHTDRTATTKDVIHVSEEPLLYQTHFYQHNQQSQFTPDSIWMITCFQVQLIWLHEEACDCHVCLFLCCRWLQCNLVKAKVTKPMGQQY